MLFPPKYDSIIGAHMWLSERFPSKCLIIISDRIIKQNKISNHGFLDTGNSWLENTCFTL